MKNGMKTVRRAIALMCVLVIVAMAMSVLGGCQASIEGAVFYPNSWKSAGDPAASRLGAQGVNPGFGGMKGGD